MSASILLLLVLQILWLQNSYEKAFFDLRRDGNFVFRNTLFSLRDSIFLKSVKAVPHDSLFPDPTKIESIQVIKKRNGDSLKITRKSSTVQVFVRGTTGSNDSIADMLRPMASNFNFQAQDGKRFLIQLEPDTISVDSLESIFSKALLQADLPLKFFLKHEYSNSEKMPFRMRMDATPQEPSRNMESGMYKDTIRLEPVRLNPLSRYSASFINFRGFILKEIFPQILFSLLLTSITIIAFIVLYKNLRSQQRLMELKNDFISNVTHELKTPVATVSVALEALKNFHGLDNPARTKEYLEIAQNELKRLTLMTDKILKASVFENNGVVIQKESVDIQKITQQILDSLKLLFDKQKAQVSFQTEGNNFIVEGEAAHLTNVIYNFLDNALKYSPEHPQINIQLKETPTNLILSIQDNGIGIAPEYKKKVFEKFFRVPTGDVHNIKGYGLGLSYVASVMKAHGGTVDVVSEPGKGSNFIATFPKVHE